MDEHGHISGTSNNLCDPLWQTSDQNNIFQKQKDEGTNRNPPLFFVPFHQRVQLMIDQRFLLTIVQRCLQLFRSLFQLSDVGRKPAKPAQQQHLRKGSGQRGTSNHCVLLPQKRHTEMISWTPKSFSRIVLHQLLDFFNVGGHVCNCLPTIASSCLRTACKQKLFGEQDDIKREMLHHCHCHCCIHTVDSEKQTWMWRKMEKGKAAAKQGTTSGHSGDRRSGQAPTRWRRRAHGAWARPGQG